MTPLETKIQVAKLVLGVIAIAVMSYIAFGPRIC